MGYAHSVGGVTCRFADLRATEFEAWLEKMKIVGADGRLAASSASPLLAAARDLA